MGPAAEAAEPMLHSEEPGSAQASGPAAPSAPSDAPMKIFGVQVFIDPETGLMRAPSPEEAAALAAEMQRQFGARSKAATEPRQVMLADGTVMMELDPSLYSVSVARVLPNGTVSFECVKGHDHGLDDGRHAHSGAETE
ncbi:MAG TPA: hypothetical protein VLT32_15385 [Candidatus Sulfomarinibacteraceae bacterium]|nr:hypothetical protein [Candidatus Sulfomarinibacteraceae bacterium]